MSTPPNEPQANPGDMFKKDSEASTPETPADGQPQDAPAGQWGRPDSGQPAPGQWQSDPGQSQWQSDPAAQAQPGQWQADPAAQSQPGQWQDAQTTQYNPGAAGQQPPGGYPAGGVYNYPPMGGQPQGAQAQGGYPSYPQQPYAQPYGQPGQPGYQPYGAQPYGAPQPRGTQIFSIIGFICAGIALLFCPPIFGIAGIVLGIIGSNKGEPLGKWAAIASGVALVVGMLIGLALYGSSLTR
ncbi:hypothetical protein ACFVUS_32820 [Nocardia sp. NPDC058058]|uniref:hypothetical protein n=1 Tax=Nocardia sp. NPDC058058 TaxID=3346317 RepID=UPI0036D8555B